MRFFDLSRPADWKWPAVAFVLVSGACLTANVIARPNPHPKFGWQVRGWPYVYWQERGFLGGGPMVRGDAVFINLGVSALLAAVAAVIVRCFTAPIAAAGDTPGEPSGSKAG